MACCTVQNGAECMHDSDAIKFRMTTSLRLVTTDDSSMQLGMYVLGR